MEVKLDPRSAWTKKKNPCRTPNPDPQDSHSLEECGQADDDSRQRLPGWVRCRVVALGNGREPRR